MRRVNWSPDERVDVPDMMAATSGLMESEFRRLLSQWALGYEITAILRGFEVEPEAVPSSRIVVRMDRSADAVPFLKDSMALAAEDLGSRIDFGVMLGGRGSDGVLEGPAQQVLDFAPQPPGLYAVEMRTIFTEATNDNRAFWDEGTDSEFSQATNTRVLQSWELRASPSVSGGAWVPLAIVAWAGGTIDAGDITDGRFMLTEGFAVSGFDAPTQTSAQFDFDRSPLRGKFGVGSVSPLAALSALQRQVLDLKGQDERGFFNWYSRTFSPAGGESLWGKHTKSLRTTDVVTFTVGWPSFGGFGDWGDFNGEFGLNDCLTFIQNNATVLPRKIKIVVKNRIPGIGEGTLAQHRMITPVVLPNKDIEILGELGQGKNERTLFEVAKDVRGQIQIANACPQFSTALQMTGRCSLRMENLTWIEPLYEVHHVVLSGPVRLRNCVMLGYAIGGGYVALHCHSDQSDIDQCWFGGVVNYGGGDDVIHAHGGSVRHAVFDRCILQLRTSIVTGALSTVEILQGTAQKVQFEHCTMFGRIAFSGLNQPSAAGCVDTRGASHISFDHCKLFHSCDENGISFGNLISGIDAGSVNSGLMDVGYCEAAMIEDVTTHGYRAGVNGVDGTGWHLFCKHQNLTQSSQRTAGLSVHDCWFPGGVLGTPPSPDAGALSFISACNVSVRDNRFTDWVDSAVPGFIVLANIASDGAGTGFTQVDGLSFCNNYFGDWLSDIQKVVCAAFTNVFSARICGNTFRRFKREQGSATAFGGAALTLTNSLDFWLCDNDFVGFVDVVDPVNTNCNVVLSGVLADGHVNGNVLADFGGIGIGAAFHSIANVEFNHNVFAPHDLSELGFGSAIDLNTSGSTENVTFMGNRWNYVGGTGGTNQKVGIHVGNATSFTVMGNHFDVGQIKHRSLGGVQAPKATGYAVTHPDLNYAFYT